MVIVDGSINDDNGDSRESAARRRSKGIESVPCSLSRWKLYVFSLSR
jgi:hypothetical protein